MSELASTVFLYRATRWKKTGCGGSVASANGRNAVPDANAAKRVRAENFKLNSRGAVWDGHAGAGVF